MLSNDEGLNFQHPWRSRRRLILAAATWGGVGYLPGMPGTWGTLASLPLWWMLTYLGFWGYGLALVALAALSIPITGWAQDYLGHDHPAIVLDEVVGLLAALAWVPFRWQWVVTGFVLFRVFDIWKPSPIKYCERLPGGWGVTLDDLAAGVLARGVLAVIIMFLGGSK